MTTSTRTSTQSQTKASKASSKRSPKKKGKGKSKKAKLSKVKSGGGGSSTPSSKKKPKKIKNSPSPSSSSSKSGNGGGGSSKKRKPKSNNNSSSGGSSKKKSKIKSKNKHKNNTKNKNYDDYSKSPFNTQPNTPKEQSIQHKKQNLMSNGLSSQQASKLLRGTKNKNKSVKQLLRGGKTNSNSWGNNSGGGSSKKRKRKPQPQLPPITHYLPTFAKRNSKFWNNGAAAGTSYPNTAWYQTQNPIQNYQDKQESDSDSEDSDYHPTSKPTSTSTPNNIIHNQYKNIPTTTKNKLQNEIIQFYNYVKLTKNEIDARKYIISCIESETKSLFDVKVVRMNPRRTRAQLESRVKNQQSKQQQQQKQHGGVKVQTFGSFATPQISTFWSDVDLALWNIIEDDDDDDDANDVRYGKGKHDNFLKEIVGWGDKGDDDNKKKNNGISGNDSDNDNDSSSDDDSDSDNSKGDNIVRMTTSSIQRTMQLLKDNNHNNIDNNNGHDDHNHIQQQEEKKARVNKWKLALSLSAEDEDDDNGNVKDAKDSKKGGKDENQLKGRIREEKNDLKKSKNKQDGYDDTISTATSPSNDKKTSLSKDISKTINVDEHGKCDNGPRKKINKTETDVGNGKVNNKHNEADFVFVIDREGEREFGGDDSDVDKDDEKTGQLSEASVIEISSDDDDDSLQEKVPITSSKVVIEIEDSDENNAEGNENENDDDSVDIMDSYYNRDEEENITLQQQRGHGKVINVQSPSANSFDSGVDDPYDELKDFAKQFESSDGTDLNVSTSPIDHGAVARNNNPTVIGPQGDTRKMVVKALRILSGKIHQSAYATSVETRTQARVPIICVTTRLGFDGDIALGGHNGTDTSHYVRKQVEKYDSFATVTLLLKVLLQQTNLDKPFSGGLGSYKLYVMVAYHFKKHISLGGGTSPAEILVSFLFRYSDLDLETESMDPRTQTDISKPTFLQCDGGEADLNNGVKLERCGRLFGECFERIMHKLEEQCHGNDVSLIGSIIDSSKLTYSRKRCLDMAAQWKQMKRSGDCTYFPYQNPSPIVAGRKVGFTFSKPGFNGSRNSSSTQPNRGPRGGLIPKHRPDLDAKPKGLDALFLKARKNRKNKKKQKRDTALREFATAELNLS